MKIGELAKRTGLAPSKIRFYEAHGLIAPVQRQANGYRDYLPNSVQLLEIIITAQAAGFSLHEIRHLLPTAGIEKWSWQKLIDTLERKVAEMELLQRRLRQNKAKLLEVIQYAKQPDQPCGNHAEHLMKKLTPIVRQRALRCDIRIRYPRSNSSRAFKPE
jgi:DNA-binding transcriptional MerR regulator